MNHETFIIVDIGSNHRGNLGTAKKQIERAAECKVNAVKFQYFSEKDLYGIGNDRKSTPKEWFPELQTYAKDNGVEFMCSAFSVEGVEFVDKFVDKHKLASCEMQHIDMIEALITTGKQTIISNGGAHFGEQEQLLNLFDEKKWKPWILECVASYPANFIDYNLTNLPEYQSRTGRTGISDHTTTLNLVHPAIQLGATIFEVHADLVLGTPTPDSPVSLDYTSLARYSQFVKECMARHENDLEKRQVKAEEPIIRMHKRRLKVTKHIPVGGVLKKGENYGIYRSKDDDLKAGPPSMWALFEGKAIKEPKKPGDPLWHTDLR